jgi:hypothetical protein
MGAMSPSAHAYGQPGGYGEAYGQRLPATAGAASSSAAYHAPQAVRPGARGGFFEGPTDQHELVAAPPVRREGVYTPGGHLSSTSIARMHELHKQDPTMSSAEIGELVGREAGEKAVPRTSVHSWRTRRGLLGSTEQRTGLRRIPRASMLTAESWIRYGGQSALEVATQLNVTNELDLARLQDVETQTANSGG